MLPNQMSQGISAYLVFWCGYRVDYRQIFFAKRPYVVPAEWPRRKALPTAWWY